MGLRKGAASARLPPCASGLVKAYRSQSNGLAEARQKRATRMTLVFPKESLSAFPKHLTPDYRSTVKRSPSKPLIVVPQTLSELTGPLYGHDAVQESDADLTKQHKSEP